MNDDLTPERIYMTVSLGLMAFTAETDGVMLPWLLMVPAPWATIDQIDKSTQALQEDGWSFAITGNVPVVESWTVRVVGTSIYLRQHGGEPLNTRHDEAAPWRDLIRSTGGINLVFDPDGSIERYDVGTDLASSPFVLVAHARLENV